jgi:site-specific DNA-cytosine methylase
LAPVAADADAAREPRTVAVVELAAGIGGGLYAAHAALERLRAEGVRTRVSVAHASDADSEKVALYSSGAGALGVMAAAEVVDVRDETYFSVERIAAWGKVDLLVACIICKTLSSAGKREGLVAVMEFIKGLYRIVSLCRPAQLFLECVEGIERDKLFNAAIIQPLEAMGYLIACGTRAGSDWSDARRDRWYAMATRSMDEFNDFDTLPPPPDRRVADLTLRRVLLGPATTATTAARRAAPAAPTALRALRSRTVHAPPPRAAAPQWAYLPHRPTTVAGEALRSALVAGRTGRSAVANYQFQRVNAPKGRVAPTLTATASSDWHLRDAHGLRVVVAVEAAALHGYTPDVIAALLHAARDIARERERAARARGMTLKGPLDARADAIVRSAVGDGFMLPVVTDMLYRMLRARLRRRAESGADAGPTASSQGHQTET